MTALLLKPETGVTVTSATNVNAASSKDHMLRDRLGLDTRFTGDTVIILDRGAANASISWDCIAFVQTTIVTTATVKIEYSNDGTFAAGVTTIGPITVPITSVNSSRAKCHIHELSAATTNRYIRITFASTGGGFDLGRVITGLKIKPAGVGIDAERSYDDRSEQYENGAYAAFIDRPVLLGWKCTLPWMSESYYRLTFQPFLQSVGQSQCFLFVPTVDDASTIQSDWCYGRIMAKASAQHSGHDLWVTQLTMRGIYP